jgi:hypothetical protein
MWLGLEVHERLTTAADLLGGRLRGSELKLTRPMNWCIVKRQNCSRMLGACFSRGTSSLWEVSS